MLETLTGVLGAWDLMSALSNAGTLVKAIGGAVLGVLGVIAVLTAVLNTVSKLTSEQSNKRWGRITSLFVLGGLMLAGGLTLFISIAQGAKTTVDGLGNGLILLQLSTFGF